MLLTWMGNTYGEAKLTHAADILDQALEKTLSNPAARTKDLGGTASTTDFTKAVMTNLGT